MDQLQAIEHRLDRIDKKINALIPDKAFYTSKEVGKITSVPHRTVRDWCKKNMIANVMLGNSYLIPVEEIEKLKKAAQYARK